ncbi:MAG: hypothetical protein V4615_17550 [Bacteroidota bacterium]
MEQDEIIIINGHPFDPIEVKTTFLVVFGLKNELIVRYIGGDLNDIKRLKTKLQIKFDACSSPVMVYKALKAGFDHKGCYKGVPVFTEKEGKRLKAIAPWVNLHYRQAANTLFSCVEL